MLNTIEKFLVICLILIGFGLALRYYKGFVASTQAIGGEINEMFRILSLQPNGKALPYGQ